MEDNQQKFRKIMSVFRKTARIKECFYHKKEECKGKIKEAHSLQRNGKLSIIEKEINNNMCVYSFLDLEQDINGKFCGFKPIGKGEASTFFGFCDYHDSFLFSPIENNSFDDSLQHCFLHSYRAFAHSYHRKKESLQAFMGNSIYTNTLNTDDLESSISGAKLAIRDGEIIKSIFDNLIEQKKYAELEYFTYVIDGLFPIACSSAFNLEYSYQGKLLNLSASKDYFYKFITITVLPDINKQTIIILSCLPDDIDAIEFFDTLNKLPDKKLQIAISSLMIGYVENTFMSPSIWEVMTNYQKKQLLHELELTVPPNRFNIKQFFKSKINFFDDIYKVK